MTILTIEGLGQDTRGGGLTRAPGTGEEVGVGHLRLRDFASQGCGDVTLADHIIKRLRPVFAV